MTTRAICAPSLRADLRRKGFLICVGIAGLLLLAGCGLVADDDTGETTAPKSKTERQLQDVVRQSAGEDCLLIVWERQGSGAADEDREFDRTHDAASTGGAISCATGTSASRFERVIDRLRDAATRGDKAALLAEIGVPLLYIDESGTRRVLEGEQIDAAFDEAFPPDVLAALARMDLDRMTVVPDQGGFFELGALWLVAGEPGGEPRLVSVNRQALGEAAAAARDAAEGAAHPAP